MLFSLVARGVILKLANGGQIEGTLGQISFLADGKKANLPRNDTAFKQEL
jgi:hypothetical protein